VAGQDADAGHFKGEAVLKAAGDGAADDGDSDDPAVRFNGERELVAAGREVVPVVPSDEGASVAQGDGDEAHAGSVPVPIRSSCSELILVAARRRYIAGTKWGTRRYLDMDRLRREDIPGGEEASVAV
jgi:hypothetical protein